MFKYFKIVLTYFKLPLIILGTIIIYLLLSYQGFPALSLFIIIFGILLGSAGLFKEIITGLIKKQFALDYIALVAIITSFITQEFLVGGIIALMLSTGRTLESYGIAQAKKSLSLLVNRIPQKVTLVEKGEPSSVKKISDIIIGQEIFIRKGEVIPLDGLLVSDQGYTDESSLTGEPYHIEKVKGDLLRSGTVNIGGPMIIKVAKEEKNSTYRKIIEMVQEAQEEKSPFIRLADKYSTVFTLVTFAIALFAWFLSNDLERVLAVLVIATPCPLILATPIALLGGVNKAAKKRIIIKKLASLESLSRINTFVFDKTGTITIGKPDLKKIEVLDNSFSEDKILAVSLAIERNSLHPIAKTIVVYAKAKKVNALPVSHITEIVGSGISGRIEGKTYTLSKIDEDSEGMIIKVLEGQKKIALLHFEDNIKKESINTMAGLKNLGLELHIFTGDRESVAQHISRQIGHGVAVRSQLSPHQKLEGITDLKKENKTIAMVGDGINDAPALAKADVGLVFSNEEQTAASQAADIVLLGGDFSLTRESISIAKRTIHIAKQSIFWGIGLSIFGMILASFGLIPPIVGAGIQEAIDVAVIINALRASR